MFKHGILKEGIIAVIRIREHFIQSSHTFSNDDFRTGDISLHNCFAYTSRESLQGRQGTAKSGLGFGFVRW
jgi:hypothetical protein